MKVRFLITTFALIAAGATASPAQTRKKTNEQSQQHSTQPKVNNDYPRCEGTLFLLDETGTVHCRRSDGKLCSLSAGSGGQAELRNCR